MTWELEMWTIYDHPSDYPDHFVACRWLVKGGGEPTKTDEVLTDTSLERLREYFEDRGFVRMARDETDDSCIVETWL